MKQRISHFLGNLFGKNYYKILIYLKLWFSGNQPPIIVWQMGKVGSRTIVDTLKLNGYRGAIFHKHVLSDELIFSGEGYKLAKKQGNKYYLHSQALREMILKKNTRWNWKIISLTREPIGRNISAFFQNLDVYIPDYNSRSEKYNTQEVAKIFFHDFPHHEVNEWFDDEIKNLLSLDIYEKPFDPEIGYQTYSNNRFNLLVIKMEKISSVAEKAISEFLNMDNINLVNSNISKDKAYSSTYKDLKNSIIIPQDYLDEMYESKYTSYFYSNIEINEFRLKWER